MAVDSIDRKFLTMIQSIIKIPGTLTTRQFIDLKQSNHGFRADILSGYRQRIHFFHPDERNGYEIRTLHWRDVGYQP